MPSKMNGISKCQNNYHISNKQQNNQFCLFYKGNKLTFLSKETGCSRVLRERALGWKIKALKMWRIPSYSPFCLPQKCKQFSVT